MQKIFLIFAVVLLGLTACRQSAQNDGGQKPPTSMDTTAARELVDDLGKTVKLPAKVERVVSLAPNLTEIVFALDAGDRLAGVTEFCNYPDEAKNIAKIGDTMKPNLETIIALKPQLVLVSTASQIETFTARLSEQNIPVFVTNPDSLESVYSSIEKVGQALGKQEKASEVITQMKARVEKVERESEAAAPFRVFVQVSKEPLFTVGSKSYITDMIERAGAFSVTANISEAYPKLSKETALAAQPDVIILSDSPDNKEPNEVFTNSPAVKNKRVYAINADLLSRPGPRMAEALEEIVKVVGGGQ